VSRATAKRRIGFFALAWMTAVTFACFLAMRFIPRRRGKEEWEA